MATHLIPRSRAGRQHRPFRDPSTASRSARASASSRPPSPRLVVVLVSAAAFFVVRANVLATLDANLLQRATAAAQSGIDPRVLTQVPPQFLGAADIKLAFFFADGTYASA